MTGPFPELAGLTEAEDFFAALGVPHDPRVLDAHRLHVMKAFGLALGSWVSGHPDADPEARRRAAGRALREAHDVFAGEERSAERRNPFASGLVQLGRRR